MSERPLILSVFPGVDLLGRAFEEEWPEACIVRGPDLIFGGDVRSFHPPAGRFDGVIGGPPCQMFSRLRHLNPLAGSKHGNMIPEFERCVAEAAPEWFLMENVEGAPLPEVPGYQVHAQLIRDVWVGGETMRLRRFSFGTQNGTELEVEQLALHAEPVPAALAGNGGGAATAFLSTATRLQRQGLPADFLADAPFTAQGKAKAIGNGVPLPMGRAVARAVRRALGHPTECGSPTQPPGREP